MDLMSTIEVACSQDIDELVALLGELFEQEEDFVPNPQKQRQALTQLLESPSVGIILVSRIDGNIVAMVSLLFTISTAEGGYVCWLEDMVVRRDRRGNGVGSELLCTAIAEAMRRNLSRITLLTDRSNAASRAFYARHGFADSNMGPMRLNLSMGEHVAHIS
jgi:GNAT superfamily N-acetyltransferase